MKKEETRTIDNKKNTTTFDNIRQHRQHRQLVGAGNFKSPRVCGGTPTRNLHGQAGESNVREMRRVDSRAPGRY
ncbi:hypothetical protein ANO14919_145090 [Xylariales sp. No.14919]|nr:hypothetical protein ANO14919_145090 [Xylariales sp. No.14919]